jgi:hypothetical protein
MPNLFPSVSNASSPATELGGTSGGQVKFGRSWRFDYGKGDFTTTPTGKIAASADVEAWLEWCKKTLHTERYTYLAYSRSYGQEFEELIPRNLSRRANESEIVRMTTEALKVDPRTYGVGAFSFEWEGERCYFQCEVTNVRGQKSRIDGSVVTG